MNLFSRLALALILCVAGLGLPLPAMSDAPKIGIVIMHGKGSSPTRNVGDLANALEAKGFLVANLEMPWSGKRDYDAPVSAAEAEVEAALAKLRGQGAQKVFVAGHSQGGVFALHFAGQHAVDGVICMAPGGSVASKVFREKLGTSIERARQLVAQGKGEEKARLEDYEGKKGVYPVVSAPAVYLTWFDPEGAMNSNRGAKAANPKVPILWLVAKRDYPGLRDTNIPLFESLPKNPHTRMVEPDSDHTGAPSAALEEILRWTAEVAGAGG